MSGPPDDDLMRIDGMRMEGSGQWIFEKEEFRQWQNGPKNQIYIYWVDAQLAAGKSVFAGAVMSHLKSIDYVIVPTTFSITAINETRQSAYFSDL